MRQHPHGDGGERIGSAKSAVIWTLGKCPKSPVCPICRVVDALRFRGGFLWRLSRLRVQRRNSSAGLNAMCQRQLVEDFEARIAASPPGFSKLEPSRHPVVITCGKLVPRWGGRKHLGCALPTMDAAPNGRAPSTEHVRNGHHAHQSLLARLDRSSGNPCSGSLARCSRLAGFGF